MEEGIFGIISRGALKAIPTSRLTGAYRNEADWTQGKHLNVFTISPVLCRCLFKKICLWSLPQRRDTKEMSSFRKCHKKRHIWLQVHQDQVWLPAKCKKENRRAKAKRRRSLGLVGRMRHLKIVYHGFIPGSHEGTRGQLLKHPEHLFFNIFI